MQSEKLFQLKKIHISTSLSRFSKIVEICLKQGQTYEVYKSKIRPTCQKRYVKKVYVSLITYFAGFNP